MRAFAFDRDLIRGGHYGQRPCVPHKKAEYMAAPTNAASEDSPCQPGAVHTWPQAKERLNRRDVRRRGPLTVSFLTHCRRRPDSQLSDNTRIATRSIIF